MNLNTSSWYFYGKDMIPVQWTGCDDKYHHFDTTRQEIVKHNYPPVILLTDEEVREKIIRA